MATFQEKHTAQVIAQFKNFTEQMDYCVHTMRGKTTITVSDLELFKDTLAMLEYLASK